MKKISSLLFVLLVSVFSFAVSAQDVKPADKPADKAIVKATDKATEKTPEKTVDVPKHGCKKPDDPGKITTEAQQKKFQKAIDEYRDCLTAYRGDMNKLAQAHIDAANGAIQEFNDYVMALNAANSANKK